MTIYQFGTLTNGSILDLDPSVDSLNFGDPSIDATQLRLEQKTDGVHLTVGSKSVVLRGLTLEDFGVDTLSFADGSGVLLGDGSTSTSIDWYGAEYALGTLTDAAQIWGLGGADHVISGSGNDLLVGNGPLTALNHVSRSGATGSPNASSHASISADGRFVAFAGGWTGFGSSSNSATDVFVKDLTKGTISDEHRSGAGVDGNSGSGSPVISGDGKALAFVSASSNLVSGNASGGLYDIYLADVTGNGISRVSTGSGGALAADGRSLNPDLSFDGRYVVFESDTTNWSSGSIAGRTDIFLKDTVGGTLKRISTSLTGGDGNGESTNAHISADGRYVVFQSAASNLTSGDGNGQTDIFLWDRSTGSLKNLTKALAAVSNPNNGNFNAAIAADGDYGGVVVFETARNLVAEDTHNATDIYAYNLSTKQVQWVSCDKDGQGVGVSSGSASISGDGRFVVFIGGSDALVPGDANGVADVFVKDLFTGAIALVSRSAAGVAGNLASGAARISLGGDWIVFESAASTLASTDGNGTGTDVFRVSNPLLFDTLEGGAGNDTYVLNRNDVVIEAPGGGIDLVEAAIGYTLGANVENLTLTGTANLKGIGNGLNNVITGNAGNNFLDGRGGVDTVSYANSGHAVTVNLGLGTAQGTGFGSDTLRNFENLQGSAFADKLTGNAGANAIWGGAGNDTLIGGDGNDSLIGGDGIDSLTGGAGNDTLDGGGDGDVLIGGTGNDTYIFATNAGVIVENPNEGIDTVRSAVTWTLGATLENLVLTGNAAINGSGNQANNVITGNGAANILNGYNGNDTLTGGDGNDTLKGGAGNDLLKGGDGIDTLIGGDGNDTLDGGAGGNNLTGGTGDDIYIFASNVGVIVENPNEGIDTVKSAVTWTLGSTLENLVLTGTAATNGSGNQAANAITGNGAANILSGFAGNDTLTGGGGNDTLVGGGGRDTLSGGGGADSFKFNALSDTGTSGSTCDLVTDFTSGSDHVDLRALETALGQHFTYIGTDTFASHGNATALLRFAYDAATNQGTLLGSTDADTAAEFQIQFTGLANMAAGDLWL